MAIRRRYIVASSIASAIVITLVDTHHSSRDFCEFCEK